MSIWKRAGHYIHRKANRDVFSDRHPVKSSGAGVLEAASTWIIATHLWPSRWLFWICAFGMFCVLSESILVTNTKQLPKPGHHYNEHHVQVSTPEDRKAYKIALPLVIVFATIMCIGMIADVGIMFVSWFYWLYEQDMAIAWPVVTVFLIGILIGLSTAWLQHRYNKGRHQELDSAMYLPLAALSLLIITSCIVAF